MKIFLGCPLSLVESPYWNDFFQLINPYFVVPSRYAVSNSLLNKVFEKTEERVVSKVSATHSLALQCDGWSNIKGEGIINFILNTPQPVFFKTVETKVTSQTGVYLENEMAQVIDVAGPKKVLGVVTDNASNNIKAHSLLEKRYEKENIQFYGCAAHVFNLLAKDICKQKSALAVTEATSKMVTKIKKSKLVLAKFKSIQELHQKSNKSLKTQAATRFSTYFYSLESIELNKFNLQQLAISDASDDLEKSIRDNILSEEFWLAVNKLIKFLKPICLAIKKVEEDDSRIFEVPKMFQDLEIIFKQELAKNLSLFNVEESEKILKSLQERKLMALRPIHYAACILDPNCKGSNLDEESYISGSTLITKLAPKFDLSEDLVSTEFINYKAGVGVWSNEHLLKTATLVRPNMWWKSMCAFSCLHKIAVAILELPCTSASTERSFSTNGWIHNAKRNRLLAVRAGKITYIAFNLKFLDKDVYNKKTKTENQLDQSDVNDQGDESGENYQEDEEGEDQIPAENLYLRYVDEAELLVPADDFPDESFPNASEIFNVHVDEVPDSFSNEIYYYTSNNEIIALPK